MFELEIFAIQMYYIIFYAIKTLLVLVVKLGKNLFHLKHFKILIAYKLKLEKKPDYMFSFVEDGHYRFYFNLQVFSI